MLSFEECFSIGNLERHYEDFLRSHLDVVQDVTRSRMDSDRIELRTFNRDLAKHLRAARRKVIEGRYTFAPFLELEKPKGDGASRTISISTIRDGIIQRALNAYLYEFVERQLEDCVFGYRGGRNAHMAVDLVQSHFRNGRVAVFDADIAGFFDSLDHQILIDKISALGIDDRANNLVKRFVKTSRILADATKRVNAASGKQQSYPRTARKSGVPQGGVLSGLLSNLYLANFDKRIQREFGGLVRYADDFVICTPDEARCTDIRLVVESELEQIGLRLHSEKTSTCLSAATGIDFLGFQIFPDVLRIRKRNIRRFKERITKVVATQQRRRNSEKTLHSLCRRLAFKIQGPGPEIMEKLIAQELSDHPFRRSWIGFFRIVTDENQIRQLDRWIAAQISSYIWGAHGVKINRSQMAAAGLPTVYSTMWKARRHPQRFNRGSTQQ